MIKITIATSNPHKLAEINAINKNPEIVFDIISKDFNPEENGKTFLENAQIKATEAAKITKTYCLADDSGLCVDALEGEPGIYSARYADSQEEKIQKILKQLKTVPYEFRGARFVCAMVLVDKNGEILKTTTGNVFGYIDDTPKGTNGFGYDPIFLVPEYDKTIAQLSEETKNTISHRAKALKSMLNYIEENLI